jgi:hypothetical protein
LRLRLKEDNNLSERRINSSGASKVNVVKQVIGPTIKIIIKKACFKGKKVVKKLNDNCFYL